MNDHNTNKQSFFIIDSPKEQEQYVTEEIKTIQGRINSIALLEFDQI
jgi:hypothetical protein